MKLPSLRAKLPAQTRFHCENCGWYILYRVGDAKTLEMIEKHKQKCNGTRSSWLRVII